MSRLDDATYPRPMNWEVKNARDSLRTCVVVGLLLEVIGGVCMALAWPGEEVTLGVVEQTGSALLAIVGGILAWAGSSLLFVGLTGYGVMLGREAAPTSSSVAS